MTTIVKPLDRIELNNRVLARFAAELAAAGPEQLEHLARRAECRCCTDLGERMRALVDDERARRVFTAALTATSALGADFWAVRVERWEAAGRVGAPDDAEYDDFFYQGRPGGEGGCVMTTQQRFVAARPARTWLVSAIKHPARSEEVDELAASADGGLSVYVLKVGLPPYLGVWVDPEHGNAWHLYSDYPGDQHERFGWRRSEGGAR